MRDEFIAIGIEWVAVSSRSVGKAERRLLACQACSLAASRPFASVLAEVLDADTSDAQYILCAPAECPCCNAPIVEDTLVHSEGEGMHPGTAFVEERGCDGHVVLVDELLLAEAEDYVAGCEYCMGDVGIAFDYVLDAVTGSSPTLTEYVMCRAAKCPSCLHAVNEKTLVVLCSAGH